MSGALRKLPWYVRYRLATRLASRWRMLLIKATHRHCTVIFQGPARLGPGFTLEIPDRGTLIVGPGVDFRRGFVCEIFGDGRVEIGAGSTFTSNALIQCTTTIEIGRGCVFAQSVSIADGNHRFRDPDSHIFEQGYNFRPIHIGDGAFITSKCTVLSDVGERAVVAASSVVTKPIPAFCLAGGAPARVLEYFGPPDKRPAPRDG